MTALKAFFRADWPFRRLLLEVLILLGVGRLSVLVFPFKKIAGWMGQVQEETLEELSEAHRQSLVRLASAILAVSKYTPWNSNCFAQALCAHWVLKRRGWSHTIYFGVKKEEHKLMKAHAWLRMGNKIVTGRVGHKQYTVLSKFAYLP
ncbi:MAG: lasso peptide biosynthesis B2 protein [Roseivirga sp.]|nr:lasso peptide biosynthesis B2 protein [Roseivirga sp.]